MGTPYLQRESFRVKLPEDSVFTFVTLRDPPILESFFWKSVQKSFASLNLTDMEAWVPGLARSRERKQPVQVYIAVNG